MQNIIFIPEINSVTMKQGKIDRKMINREKKQINTTSNGQQQKNIPNDIELIEHELMIIVYEYSPMGSSANRLHVGHM